MTRTNIPQLSKTRFMAGLQCLKRLYLESYHRELLPPVDASQQALFDSGNAVGVLARGVNPGGLLITEDYFNHDRAAARTRQAVADGSIPSIYEAAFTYDGIRTRVDILQRLNQDVFALAEVKSSTSVKQEHIPDSAVQVYVAEGSGIEIRNIYLVHIDRNYVFQGGEYALDKLFYREDVTAQVRSYMETSIISDLARIRDALAQDDTPAVDIGRQCTKPYECPFFSHCREGLPDHHVEQLPGARVALLDSLKSAGITDIASIFSGFPGLTRLQERVRESVVSGEAYVGRDLATELSGVEYPLRYLDFETFNPALPYYLGTRPYQVIPFQWSMHIQHADGRLEHREFLHEGPDDPRPAFISSLSDAAGNSGSIVTYSGYEETRLKQLAGDFPEYANSLLALVDRMYDLLKVIRAHYYHPAFHGSFSLKAVLPALVPELGYEDLEINDGSMASVAYAQMIHPATEEFERGRIYAALLAYCQRDTEAMVRVFGLLRSVPR
ncbi:MAG: DUF2779 domain-containing protein [Dehalococcoidia bacterium]|nr:DUF2779 domain-containing protein [Dehalococcoidia bacterium]